MDINDLNKSRIININDFIFRQNLEFYPNLQGISCENNVLTYKVNGEIKESITLTFDLRTLPGYIWNLNCKEFMDAIRFNKKCMTLGSIADEIVEENKKYYGEVA